MTSDNHVHVEVAHMFWSGAFQRKTKQRSTFLSGTTIERMSTYKILGMHISEDLTWNMDINYIFKKAKK